MEITVRQMYDANIHFGHQTRSWNPKMKPYIFGEFGRRNKIHIIDLDKSLPLMRKALKYVHDLAAKGGTIMIVSTRSVTADLIKEEAERCGMPYTNYRWPGGTLTNFSTVRKSVNAYQSLLAKKERGDMERMRKKDAVNMNRKLQKMERLLGGMVNMHRVPDALFIIDVGYEKNALHEAVALNLPVVAVVDTNNSYENVDYMIPGNDDAISSVKFYVSAVADAVLEGRKEYEENAEAEPEVMELGVVSGDATATTAVNRVTKRRAASGEAGATKAEPSEPKSEAKAETQSATKGEAKAETKTAAKTDEAPQPAAEPTAQAKPEADAPADDAADSAGDAKDGATESADSEDKSDK